MASCISAPRVAGLRSAAPLKAQRSAARPAARNVVVLAKKTIESESEGKEGIDFSGIKQLISMGMGTMAGDITEINLDDPTRTVVMELEANNFEDKDGTPLSLKYMNNKGVVAEEDEKAPIANLILPVILAVASIAGVVATLKALA